MKKTLEISSNLKTVPSQHDNKKLVSPSDDLSDAGPYCNTRSKSGVRPEVKPDKLFPLKEIPLAGEVRGIGFVNASLTASEVRAFKKELSNLVEDPIRTAQQID